MAVWLSGWQYRKKITIDETKVDADLTDFPATVILTSSNFNFSKARSDGYDIRFTSSDGTTLLKYERERHDSANQVAEYHVKIPFVSSSSNTDFYIYYGNPFASDGADPTNVWDSYFKGVWHLKDYTASQVNDSTTNANNGTKKAANEPNEIDGKIGKAQNFDGVDDYVSVPDSSSLRITSQLTVEAWVYPKNPGATDKNKVIFRGATFNFQPGYDNTYRTFRFEIYTTTWTGLISDNYAVDWETWQYFVCTYDGSYIRIYKNGVEIKNKSQTGSLSSPSATLYFGCQSPSTASYYGLSDEIRISNVARSAAWIKASYNSGNNSLLSYGNEEFLPAFLLFFN